MSKFIENVRTFAKFWEKSVKFPRFIQKFNPEIQYFNPLLGRDVLVPLAQRAAQLSPADTKLWRLLLKLNSKRSTYAGRAREAEQAYKGAVYMGKESDA